MAIRNLGAPPIEKFSGKMATSDTASEAGWLTKNLDWRTLRDDVAHDARGFDASQSRIQPLEAEGELFMVEAELMQ